MLGCLPLLAPRLASRDLVSLANVRILELSFVCRPYRRNQSPYPPSWALPAIAGLLGSFTSPLPQVPGWRAPPRGATRRARDTRTVTPQKSQTPKVSGVGTSTGLRQRAYQHEDTWPYVTLSLPLCRAHEKVRIGDCYFRCFPQYPSAYLQVFVGPGQEVHFINSTRRVL